MGLIVTALFLLFRDQAREELHKMISEDELRDAVSARLGAV